MSRLARQIAVGIAAWLAFAGPLRAQTQPVELYGTAAGTDRLSILIVPDGFTGPELKATQGDATWPVTNTRNSAKSWEVVCKTIVEKMFKCESYAVHRDLFHIRRLDVPSPKSGTPQNGFGSDQTKHANREGSSRFSIEAHPDGVYPSDVNKATMEARALVKGLGPVDLVLIVANTEVYGGSAFSYNTGSGTMGVAVTTLHMGDRAIPEVDADGICEEYGNSSTDWTHTTNHEIGHGLFNLCDEYPGLEPGPDEPANANVTLVSDRARVKWKKFIGQGGVGDPIGKNGLYHPAKYCKMNVDARCRFCIVCQSHIESRTFQQLSLIEKSTPLQSTLAGVVSNALTFTIKLVPFAKVSTERTFYVDWYVNSKHFTSTRKTGTAQSGETHALVVPPADLHSGPNSVSCVVASQSKFSDPRVAPPLQGIMPSSRQWQVDVKGEPGRPNSLVPMN